MSQRKADGLQGPMALILHGYRPSVYTRIARLALTEKEVAHDRVEINPFLPDAPADYLDLHPFNCVPTLVYDGFILYETGAITRYVDRCFPGPRLQPTEPRALARMDQIIGTVDSYGYWPLVRQVYVHAVALPRRGQPGDATEIAKGLEASARVLAALEALAADATYLTGPSLSLADLHLVPMIAYFVEATEGAAMLKRYRKLGRWFTQMSAHPSYATTDPR
jgi:glutathione S-transferase